MIDMDKFYNDIPIGKEYAITKHQLGEIWGCKDERTVRAIIAELRSIDNNDNYIIVSSSTNGRKGYYRTDNVEEIEAYKKETMNRARHTFIPLKKVNRVLRSQDQFVLFD